MDPQLPIRDRGRSSRRLVGVATAIALIVVAIAWWRLSIQRVNLVIVNQSGVAAQLTRQPSLFGAQETTPVDGCESMSMDLGGGQFWRLEATGLDTNANALDRPWLARMIEYEIWLDPGGKSRIVGPRVVERQVGAPNPEACAIVP
jgi:hypothetical protein